MRCAVSFGPLLTPVLEHIAYCQSIEATVKHMDIFAREGLRTLVVAQAELDPVAFEQWADRYEEVLYLCLRL